jgi:hypothetical protein
VNAIRFTDLCNFLEPQWDATHTADRHKYTLYGGSRGPGKSYWLRWFAIYRLLRWAGQGLRNVRVGLFCEDYPSLKDRQISKIAQFPEWLGTLKTTKADGLGFYLHPRYGGGGILLRNLDDATKYQSVEFAGVGIDELTKNPFAILDSLRGSMRWPGISDTYFVAATNPNGRYFKWVRTLFVERDFSDKRYQHLGPIADQFAYVRALPAQNPYLGQDYWQMLDTLPDALRQAWRDGDWYVSVEGLVYAKFSEENITDDEPDPTLPIEIAIDDGYIDPRATLFIQRQPTRVLVIDELYHTKHLEEETIRKILRTSFNLAKRQGDEDDDREWPDPENKMSNRDLARALQEMGVRLPELAAVSHEATALRRRLREADIPARNWMARKAGGKTTSTRLEAVKATRALICDGKGRRPIQVHRRCKNLLDEIMSGYRNKEGPDGFEDEPADGNDHAVQALEAWIWLRNVR